jgi:hypothetical protein
MARGNSKLYRINEEHIKEIPIVSNYYVEKAYSEGYVFIKEKDVEDEIRMITSTCSQKSFQVDLINADVVKKDKSIKQYRF